MRHRRIHILMSFVLAAASGACNDDDDDDNEARRRGVGAACTADADCTEDGQRCLDFKGGYCGVADCESDLDCPRGSACVAHDEDDRNYCFLLCAEKPECNVHRELEDEEANCSANITYVDGMKTEKACVPPSG